MNVENKSTLFSQFNFSIIQIIIQIKELSAHKHVSKFPAYSWKLRAWKKRASSSNSL